MPLFPLPINMVLPSNIIERIQMNDIIKLLDLEDDTFVIDKVEIDNGTKHITVSTNVVPHTCPICNSKMKSRGIKERTIRHPILQDGYNVVITLKQRRWRCTNLNCKYDMAESFNFVKKGKQTSNAAELLIVNAFRSIDVTAAEVGRQFNISDHHAMDIFDRYVHMKRLSLPEAICIDEVYLDMDNYCKYVLVLQDFATGEPIDLVISRRKSVTEPYFVKIPRAERDNVKYLISDMYNPYLDIAKTFFHNAVPVVDSFHVMQWITHQLDLYLIKLLKQYKERDIANEIARQHLQFRPQHIPVSNEVYLLQNHRWVLLRNRRNINYSDDKKLNNHFKMEMNTYDYETRFLALDPNLAELRELKEKYAEFNYRNSGNPKAAAEELDELIDEYASSKQNIFREFSRTLTKYRQPIINSFIHYEKICNGKSYVARLSNGPVESLNRKAKDIKRNARGYTNFNHLRNRFLFALRKNSHISAK